MVDHMPRDGSSPRIITRDATLPSEGRGELKFNGGARGYIRKVPTSEGSQSARNFGGTGTYFFAR